MEALVSLRGVTRWFGRKQILAGLDLEVQPGTVTALLGRNGCGKSTALKIAMGVLERHGGEARVLGADADDLDVAQRERIAYVTDRGTASPLAWVEDEVSLHRRLRRPRFDEDRLQGELERLEVPLDRRVSALSKGEETRLRLALALAADPDVLILDEPTLGLDLFGREAFARSVIELVARREAGVVMATHLFDDVERLADHIAFVRDGKVAAQGTGDELRERFQQARLALGPGGVAALEAAAAALVGVRRVLPPDPGVPPDERAAVLSSPGEGLAKELATRAGARLLETRRLTLREIYLEVLGAPEEVKA